MRALCGISYILDSQSLIDLAGSEKATASKGKNAEGRHINQSQVWSSRFPDARGLAKFVSQVADAEECNHKTGRTEREEDDGTHPVSRFEAVRVAELE